MDECSESQFFITTHSPNFVSTDRRANNYLVLKNNGQTEITLLEKKDLWFIKKQMGVDNSDSFQSNHVLFVEGPSEEVALRKMGDLPQYAILKSSINGIDIITYNGDSHFNILTQFMRYVREFDRIPIVLYDGHKDIIEKVDELGRGRLLHPIPRQENEEFEDQFDNKTIVEAMNKLYKEGSCKFTMSEADLKHEREVKNKNVVTILDGFLQNACGENLKKTKFAEILADIVISDIKNAELSGNPRMKQKFEIEADKVMEFVNKNHNKE